MKSSSLLESSSLLHMTRPLAAAAEVSMTPPASMAPEMLMVRKPCNCKIRLSHIKQIAIADQTSIVVVVPVVSVRTDGHHYGGHLDIDRIYLSWGRTGADCATILASQAGSWQPGRQSGSSSSHDSCPRPVSTRKIG